MMDPKLAAFLSLIAWSEGTADGLDSGYGVIVSGVNGPNSFTDYSDHPFAAGRRPILVNAHSTPPLYSTASGRYQLMLHWWHPYKMEMGLADFSPASQDAVALQQMKERGAIVDIVSGQIDLAIHLCSNIWASFPGNDYGQGGKAMPALLARYAALLGDSPA
jgi:muramidase (phage lysozyme)